MKSCFVVLALVAACTAQFYDSNNDNLDVQAVVDDQKQLEAFADCFTDKKECNDVTADLKKDMPEAIQQACAKCTEAQKHIFKVFLAGLKQKLPAKYEEYRQKYDADNKYLSALEAVIASA